MVIPEGKNVGMMKKKFSEDELQLHTMWCGWPTQRILPELLTPERRESESAKST